ncbi:endonuclease [Cochleicola gelatinilyticus]|uniref:Endonuclease n=1 Tax=Cochleicola gelatinilyticus TaxID=1763537 RepID=A0A167KAQ8_9FLAO|nr:endonuclease [Cochleicola gelatinilyticus]
MGFFGKLIFWLNSVAAFLLVLSFVLPYVPPKSYPNLSLLSLAVSPLLVINALFAVYWLVRMRRQMLLSILVLAIAYFHFNEFVQFSSEGDASEYEQSLKLLSYNVRLFNAYEKDGDNSEASNKVASTVASILKEEDPDVLCIQEYYRKETVDFSAYPYKYIHFKDDKTKLGHAIFSKYPMARQGAFNFDGTYNNALYVDIVKGADTIRIYNLHLQSLGIQPQVSYLQEGNKDRLRQRISYAFSKQQDQLSEILKHAKQSKYPVIFAGDFNNTPFSYNYKTIQETYSDAFLERGNGIGTTFLFDSYPMRIDFIFTDPDFNVIDFETIQNSFSDHYPISATVGWIEKDE